MRQTFRKPIIASLAFSMLLLTATGSVGQAFKLYPGATKLAKESEEATKKMPDSGEATVYVTNDPFEKVVAFYKGFAKEYAFAGMNKLSTLPSGQSIASTFFLFDGGTNLRNSKTWVKVQRPYIGSVKMNGATPEYSDIRDVTTILLTQKK